MTISVSAKGLGFALTFAFSSKGIPTCTTKIMRGGKGMLWNDRVAVHPLPNGQIEIKKVAAETPGRRKRRPSSSSRGRK